MSTSPFFPPPKKQQKISPADSRLSTSNPISTANLPASLARKRPGPSGRGAYISQTEWCLLGAVVFVAAWVRLYVIWEPSSVVFDEVHFGGFASKYIRRAFFMDVHPPLAKLLITFAAWLGGYNGGDGDDFKDIAKEYSESTAPYVFMRMLPALLGLALVPLTYTTLRALCCTITTSVLGALLITFDNALIAQSRLILLDSPLMFFTGATVYCWIKFSSEDGLRHLKGNGGGKMSTGREFTKPWWTWLALSGTCLGLVASCKWVGLFTISTLGLSTILQLWTLLGDLRVSPRLFARHLAARALCLIVLPVVIYMSVFGIHFMVLNSSGDGDGFMSSEFQHTLRGKGMEDTFADVAYGSTITLRHLNTQGGYLHSHPHNYPTGSNQQQITLYPHRDSNNEWMIVNITLGLPPGEEPFQPDWETHTPMVWLEDKATIRLVHTSTGKRLHSHDVRPPISEVDFQNEVSGYGFEGFLGDANDNFVVELTKVSDRTARKRVRALRSHFRLRHALTGCYLFSHKVKLPEWGFEQQEVTCNKNPIWENSLWYVETNEHPLLPAKSDKINYKRPGFLAKFSELQAVMWRTNAGLTDRHAYDSRPNSWPFMRRGINFWVKNHRQIYLIGNPVIWWSSSIAVFVYLGIRVLLVLRAKRGFRDLHHPVVASYDSTLGFLTIGWALHYLPFFLMGRQLFLHHYLPALYFSVLLLAVVFDIGVSQLKRRSRIATSACFFLIVLLCYRHFSPLSYGRPWTKSQCEASKWRGTWDFSCADFNDHISDYGIQIPSPPPPIVSGAVGEDKESPEDVITTTELVQAPLEPAHVYEAVPQVPVYDAEKAEQIVQEDIAMTTEVVSAATPDDKI